MPQLTLAQTKPAAAAAAKAPSALDKTQLEAYLRYSELWLPQVAVKVDDPKPSTALVGSFDVWVHLSYNGATRDELYYVSKDGRNIVKGTAYDITRSPFIANTEVLKTDKQPSFGAAKPTVEMVVFGDFQCPVCQKEELELRQNLPATFGDKVKVYFADYPLTSIHPWAMKGSVVGRCAYQQGEKAFWDYHDWIYQHQSEITVENLDAKVQEFAKDKGIDIGKLAVCATDQRTTSEVARTIDQGHSLSVSATPTLFLNGRKIEGALDWPVLTQLLQLEIEHREADLKAKKDEECCTVTIPSLVPAKR
jgi:protein-disulfide isomerase